MNAGTSSVNARASQFNSKIAGVLCDVCNITPVPALARLQVTDLHDRGSSGNEHFLDLRGASEFDWDVPLVDVVFARG